MNPCYVKTDAGREEIRNSKKKLSRPARNLLLIIDEKHPGSNWVQLVHGATREDLQALLAAGLIAAKHDAPASAPLRTTRTLGEALSLLSYAQLYGLLTSQARDRLGLIRGFAFVLRIEACADVPQLQTLALEFMKLVQEHQGPAAARQMYLALGACAA